VRSGERAEKKGKSSSGKEGGGTSRLAVQEGEKGGKGKGKKSDMFVVAAS